MMLVPAKKQRRKVCKRERCTLERKFERLALKLPEKDFAWMMEFFDHHKEQTVQLQLLRTYVAN